MKNIIKKIIDLNQKIENFKCFEHLVNQLGGFHLSSKPFFYSIYMGSLLTINQSLSFFLLNIFYKSLKFRSKNGPRCASPLILKLPGCKVARLSSCKVVKLQGYKVARLSSCKVVKLQGYKVARLSSCKVVIVVMAVMVVMVLMVLLVVMVVIVVMVDIVVMFWSGLVLSGLVWSCLVWSSLVWSYLVWSGMFDLTE